MTQYRIKGHFNAVYCKYWPGVFTQTVACHPKYILGKRNKELVYKDIEHGLQTKQNENNN